MIESAREREGGGGGDEEAGEERNREREVRANERDKLVHPSHTHISSLSSSSSI
jgi:hypothetical protein